MQLVAAPGRTLKTYSMILAIALGVSDSAYVLARTLFDLHVMTAEHLAAANAVIGFSIAVARLIQQQIPATTEEKIAIVDAAAALPVKPGHDDVAVRAEVETPAVRAAAAAPSSSTE